MTITSEVERLDTGDTEGCKYRGYFREVLTPTQTDLVPTILTASQSGALCINGSAEGGEWTLPAAEAGLWFEFFATVSVTSTELYTVKCATGDFIIGVVVIGSATIGGSGGFHVANGTTHLGITSSGSTTGGLIGDNIILTAISDTQWVPARSVMQGSGTLATPYIT